METTTMHPQYTSADLAKFRKLQRKAKHAELPAAFLKHHLEWVWAQRKANGTGTPHSVWVHANPGMPHQGTAYPDAEYIRAERTKLGYVVEFHATPDPKKLPFSKWPLVESAAFGRFEADDRAGNKAYQEYKAQMERENPNAKAMVFWRVVKGGGVTERVAVVVTRRKPWLLQEG